MENHFTSACKKSQKAKTPQHSQKISQMSKLDNLFFEIQQRPSKGLHHSIDELNSIYPSMLKKPNKALAKYADDVTREGMEDEEIAEDLTRDLFIQISKADAKKGNATSVGNLAWIFINCKSEERKTEASERLNELRSHFNYNLQSE